MRTFARSLAIPVMVVAFAGLAISLVVHGLSLAGVNLMHVWPPVWTLHLLAMGVFGLAMLSASLGRESKGQDHPRKHEDRFSRRLFGRSSTKQDNAANEIFRAAPRWIRWMTIAFFVYAIFNFVAFLVQTEGGGPSKEDGKLLLTSHGRVIRELTPEEFETQEANVVRGFSGHWMAFFSASILIAAGGRNESASDEEAASR